MSGDALAALKDSLSVIQSVSPPFLPQNADVMTVIVDYPPGDRKSVV